MSIESEDRSGAIHLTCLGFDNKLRSYYTAGTMAVTCWIPVYLVCSLGLSGFTIR